MPQTFPGYLNISMIFWALTHISNIVVLKLMLKMKFTLNSKPLLYTINSLTLSFQPNSKKKHFYPSFTDEKQAQMGKAISQSDAGVKLDPCQLDSTPKSLN